MQLHGHTSKPGALFAVRVQHTDDSDRGQNAETADQESQKKMLWQKHKKLSAFITPDVVAATCLHNGSVTFWRSCMNLNLSCEQYNMLCGACQNLFANWKALIFKNPANIDRRLRGYIITYINLADMIFYNLCI